MNYSQLRNVLKANEGLEQELNGMRITQLGMVNFLSFESTLLTFPAQLLFVIGPNDAGKTNIIRCIEAITSLHVESTPLYYFRDKSAEAGIEVTFGYTRSGMQNLLRLAWKEMRKRKYEMVELTKKFMEKKLKGSQQVTVCLKLTMYASENPVKYEVIINNESFAQWSDQFSKDNNISFPGTESPNTKESSTTKGHNMLVGLLVFGLCRSVHIQHRDEGLLAMAQQFNKLANIDKASKIKETCNWLQATGPSFLPDRNSVNLYTAIHHSLIDPHVLASINELAVFLGYCFLENNEELCWKFVSSTVQIQANAESNLERELCVECNTRAAVVFCPECAGDKFCKGCFKDIHSNGSRKMHTKESLFNSRQAKSDSDIIFPLEMASGAALHTLTLGYLLHVAKADHVNLIVLDEPASMWHPPLHEYLRGKLSALAKSKHVMVITHSPSLLVVDKKKASILRLVKSSWSAPTQVFQLNPAHHCALEFSKTVEGRGIMFAKFVVLVEGPLDHHFFTGLQDAVNNEHPLHECLAQIHVVPCIGKTAVFVHANLCIALNIPFVIIADVDCVDDFSRSYPSDRTLEKKQSHYAKIKRAVKESKKKKESFRGGEMNKILPFLTTFAKNVSNPNFDNKVLALLKPIIEEDDLTETLIGEYISSARKWLKEEYNIYLWEDKGNGAIESVLGVEKRDLKTPSYSYSNLADEVLKEYNSANSKYQEMHACLTFLLNAVQNPDKLKGWPIFADVVIQCTASKLISEVQENQHFIISRTPESLVKIDDIRRVMSELEKAGLASFLVSELNGETTIQAKVPKSINERFGWNAYDWVEHVCNETMTEFQPLNDKQGTRKIKDGTGTTSNAKTSLCAVVSILTVDFNAIEKFASQYVLKSSSPRSDH